MPFTRNRSRTLVQVVVRSSKDDKVFYTVDVKARSVENIVRQCSRGELLFNPESKKFVNILCTKEEIAAGSRHGGTKMPAGVKTNRKPFEPKKVTSSAQFSLADRFPKKVKTKKDNA